MPTTWGLLLSLFAVLLLAFAANFHFSTKMVRRHRRAATIFAVVNFLGEVSTVIALLLTWIALWSPQAWERIDNLMVLIPGSLAICCAVFLTFESVWARIKRILEVGFETAQRQQHEELAQHTPHKAH